MTVFTRKTVKTVKKQSKQSKQSKTVTDWDRWEGTAGRPGAWKPPAVILIHLVDSMASRRLLPGTATSGQCPSAAQRRVLKGVKDLA